MSAIPAHGWMLHLMGSVLLAAAAWGLGLALQRLLRISPATPTFWMGLWLLAVLPPVLSVGLVLAAPAQMAVLPTPLGLPVALGADAFGRGAGDVTARGLAWPSLGVVLVAAWLAGVTVRLRRQLAGHLAAHRVVQNSVAMIRNDWPGPLSREQARHLQAQGIALRITAQAMTPFTVRWPQRTVVLPAQTLQHLNDRQLRLVLRHEAAHLQRRDPQRAGVMALVDALLWFNPFLRRISARVQLAAELRCDAVALADDRGAGRDFASAYLTALRLAGHGTLPAPLSALTHREMAGHRLRIQHMLGGESRPRAAWTRRLLLTTAGVGAGAAVAMAQAATLSPAPLPVIASAAALRHTVATPSALPLSAGTMKFGAPLARMQVTGHYGDSGGPRQRTHRGADFGARVGTPVLAPADGVVVAATDRYPEGPQYGTVVVLDHGHGWQSLFAHLDSTELQIGQQVARGEPIARSGRSGRVTGPHLHMELLFNGERLDPLSRLQ